MKMPINRYKILVLFIIWFPLYVTAKNTVTEIKAYTKDGKVHICYTLEKQSSIAVYSSYDKFQDELKEVNGDVGSVVSPGKKEILWDVLKEYMLDSIEMKLTFKIVADKADVNNREKKSSTHYHDTSEIGKYDSRPWIFIGGSFGYHPNKENDTQLSGGIDFAVLWGTQRDVCRGGLLLKFRTSFGYTSKNFKQYHFPVSDIEAKKDYYIGTMGGILNIGNYLSISISMGYGYRNINYIESCTKNVVQTDNMRGFAADIGVYIGLSHRVYIALSCATLRFQYAEVVTGLGYMF